MIILSGSFLRTNHSIFCFNLCFLLFNRHKASFHFEQIYIYLKLRLLNPLRRVKDLVDIETRFSCILVLLGVEGTEVAGGSFACFGHHVDKRWLPVFLLGLLFYELCVDAGVLHTFQL